MTAGSCFAQHIAARLKLHGFNVLDYEPAPKRTSKQWRAEHSFDVYSARYGNIYYARQLVQLIEEAEGIFAPEDWIWTKNDRVYDALRPSVEPMGWASKAEVAEQRKQHLHAVRRLIRDADVFVFTLGLTEGWEHKRSGTVYPTAPGTIAGTWDPDAVGFHNFTFPEIVSDMERVFELVKNVNPEVMFLLTVSPVALAATGTDNNVMVANSYSKSTLRAVAGYLSETYSFVHYFPSYDLITGTNSGVALYENNQRSVRADTVDIVMKKFMTEMLEDSAKLPVQSEKESQLETADKRQQRFEEMICEDSILEDFSQ
ncbi:GSCFA domain-containing protein [Kocuria sp. cx-116]|uniref:GSCFA domain-containing protein n=1 Tax=Kocuria sp. cx-116 TaxID=2771378 RepID=UPI001682590C|nr:GSCFA domain-containing protein [Kocuria sp. cx-116]MBD2761401.1 GSCFA domain-containing protein [Kocuria sp. cx-116]